jgi:hypothetical protein
MTLPVTHRRNLSGDATSTWLMVRYQARGFDV